MNIKISVQSHNSIGVTVPDGKISIRLTTGNSVVLGNGDMRKSVYDTDNDGAVDVADFALNAFIDDAGFSGNLAGSHPTTVQELANAVDQLPIAESQPKTDWNETDSNSPKYLENKPTITGTNTGDETASSIIQKIGDGSKISSSYLPSYVDDVIEGIWVSTTVFQVSGVTITPETGKLYVSTDTNFEYRWSGTVYVKLVASPGTTDEVPEGSTNKYFTESRTLATVLTGLAAHINDLTVTATDSILAGIGKLQGQITAIKTTLGTLKALATKDQADWNTDIANKPTIPAAQVQSDWNATTGMGAILNKPDLSNIAGVKFWASIANNATITAGDSVNYNSILYFCKTTHSVGSPKTFDASKFDREGDDKEDKTNKRSTFQATPDHTHYPTEKLVKDTFDNHQAQLDALAGDTQQTFSAIYGYTNFI